MKILALEFSSPQRSIALFNGAATGASSLVEVVETGCPPIKAFEMIEEVLKQTQVDRRQVECLAIGIGPGSYSGIRSAIALAQGWQLAQQCKILGISSVECLAAQALEESISGQIRIVIDAQRNEFYVAGYHITSDGWQETMPLRLASLDEVRLWESAEMLVGPEITKWFPGGRTLYPRATVLARLARRNTDYIPANKLEPVYLRETTFVKAPPPRVLPL